MDALFDDALFVQEDLLWPEAENYSRTAKAVEMICAAKLMLLGHHVAIPLEDDGVDLIVDYRIKVQVKSSAKRTTTGQLQLSLKGRRASERQAGGVTRLHPDVDVLAVYARDSEAWWLIPVAELGSVPGTLHLSEHLSARRSKRSALSSYLNTWSVFIDREGEGSRRNATRIASQSRSYPRVSEPKSLQNG